jgi:anti-sigma regulatory factor (Ser/Thr protein kinase)/serine/threonine protein phosphatase PrpC
MARIIRIRISTEHQVALAVVQTSAFARELGFDVQDAHAITTTVSELARNIVKYAESGEIVLAGTSKAGQSGIEIKASDRGPGIQDIEEALSDHFSSSGTLGLGLPGVERMMDELEIESTVGNGTRVTARKWQRLPRSPLPGRPKAAVGKKSERLDVSPRRAEALKGRRQRDTTQQDPRIDSACFLRPCRGERISGDAVVTDIRSNLMLMAIVDGLGHGVEANRAAIQFKQALLRSWDADVVASMERLHEELRNTIGAAAGVCTLDISSGEVRYAGVGNTVFRTFGPRPTRLHSSAGTLGAQMRSLQERRIQLTKSDVLVLYTDGISDRFELSDYPQFRYHKAEAIARTIVERFGKSHDDATCAVLRYAR